MKIILALNPAEEGFEDNLYKFMNVLEENAIETRTLLFVPAFRYLLCTHRNVLKKPALKHLPHLKYRDATHGQPQT